MTRGAIVDLLLNIQEQFDDAKWQIAVDDYVGVELTMLFEIHKGPHITVDVMSIGFDYFEMNVMVNETVHNDELQVGEYTEIIDHIKLLLENYT
jgi:hypothetical protein